MYRPSLGHWDLPTYHFGPIIIFQVHKYISISISKSSLFITKYAYEFQSSCPHICSPQSSWGPNTYVGKKRIANTVGQPIHMKHDNEAHVPNAGIKPETFSGVCFAMTNMAKSLHVSGAIKRLWFRKRVTCFAAFLKNAYRNTQFFLDFQSNQM